MCRLSRGLERSSAGGEELKGGWRNQTPAHIYDHLPTPRTTSWGGNGRLVRETNVISPCLVSEKDENAICWSMIGKMPMPTTAGGGWTTFPV